MHSALGLLAFTCSKLSFHPTATTHSKYIEKRATISCQTRSNNLVQIGNFFRIQISVLEGVFPPPSDSGRFLFKACTCSYYSISTVYLCLQSLRQQYSTSHCDTASFEVPDVPTATLPQYCFFLRTVLTSLTQFRPRTFQIPVSTASLIPHLLLYD